MVIEEFGVTRQLRYILHPVRSAKRLPGFAVRQMDRITCPYRRWLANYRLRRLVSIRRGWRDRCWCGGALVDFRWHSGYGQCVECGCYVERRPPLTEELAKIYSFQTYWYERQQIRGDPTIEQREAHDRLDGRLARKVELVERFGRAGGRVIEVGCAHGDVLVELRARGYDCIGVEYDAKTAAWVRERTGLDVRAGVFPGITLPPCEIFTAFDVIEHIPSPDGFMRQAAQLLGPGGIAVIQTPVDRHESVPPFSELCEYLFDDLEHLFIFTAESIRKLADISGMQIVAEEKGTIGVDMIVLRKGQ